MMPNANPKDLEQATTKSLHYVYFRLSTDALDCERVAAVFATSQNEAEIIVAEAFAPKTVLIRRPVKRININTGEVSG